MWRVGVFPSNAKGARRPGARPSRQPIPFIGQRSLQGLGVLLLILSTPALATAQRTSGGAPGGMPQSGKPPTTSNSTGLPFELASRLLEVHVLGLDNAPLRQQAFVRVFKDASASPVRATLTNHRSAASFNDLPAVGSYTVEVSAAGYQTQKRDFDFNGSKLGVELDVTMQPDSDAPVASYTRPPNLPGKAQKHLDKGLAEFRGGDLKSAQKELTAAYSAAPNSAEINYLLGTLCLRTNDLDHGETYFSHAVEINPADVPVLVGLGHLRYQKGDLTGAAEVLQKATALDPNAWDALWVLSEIHFRQNEFEPAFKDAERAVELGKGAAVGAEFVEGEALAEVGRNDEAVTQLQAFLRDAPADPNAPAARELAERLETKIAPKDSSAEALGPVLSDSAPDTPIVLDPTAPVLGAASLTPSPVFQLPAPKLPLQDWEPISVDEEKLALASGVTCQADDVIRETGNRVAEFIDSVNRIEAKEDVTHEQLTTLGRPVAVEKHKFNYVVSIDDSLSGFPTIDESWNSTVGPTTFLGDISMFGLADLPLVFHPALRNDFHMRCEGLGKWQDRATWLVYFRQRPDRPERIRSYGLSDGSSYSVGIKGRAWISADTYQIVRIEANLMKPLPQVGLGSEEDVIEYGPVPFRRQNTQLWLPTSADIYFYFHHRPFHRHHAFTNYSLFSVSASQKIGRPAVAEDKNNPE